MTTTHRFPAWLYFSPPVVPRLLLQTTTPICWLICILFSAASGADPVLVKVASLADLLTKVTNTAPATVVSLNESHINAELKARVIEIPVRVADIVQTNDVLARLDCRDFRHSVARADAQLAALVARRRLAMQQLARARSLARNRNVSEESVNERQSALDVLTAESDAQRSVVAAARVTAEKCVIEAPFRGVILKRSAKLGELAMPGTEIAILMDIDAVELSAQVISDDAQDLSRAQRIVFRRGNVSYPVRLRALTPVIDAVTRTREARLVFEGVSPAIGASGRLVWENAQPTLPADLLVQRGEFMGVLVADGNRAMFVAVPGALEGRPAATDLSPETLIITEGRQGVSDGETIATAH